MLSACKTNADGSITHEVFSGQVCFESITILHVTLSYIIYLIFFGMVIVSTILHYENRNTKDPTAK